MILGVYPLTFLADEIPLDTDYKGLPKRLLSLRSDRRGIQRKTLSG